MKRILLVLSMTLLCSGLAIASDNPEATYLMMPVIAVSNIEKSMKFYMDVFDLKVGFVVPAGAVPKDAREIVLTKNGKFDFKTTPALILIHTGDKPLPEDRAAYKRIVVTTSRVDTVDAHAKDAGAEIAKASSDKGRFLTDPDGYRIEIYQPD